MKLKLSENSRSFPPLFAILHLMIVSRAFATKYGHLFTVWFPGLWPACYHMLYANNLRNHWNIFCKTGVLDFRFPVASWWISLTRLAAAFHFARLSLFQCGSKRFYLISIHFVISISAPCNLSFTGSPDFHWVEIMFWSPPLLLAPHLLYYSQLSFSIELVSSLIEFQ